jgi:hypothetical protein
VIGVERWAEIRRLYFVEKRSKRAIHRLTGAPSGLAPWSPELAAGAARALDYALCANVPDKEHLPSGPLFLEGVPLVVRIWKMTQPLARTVGVAAGQP